MPRFGIVRPVLSGGRRRVLIVLLVLIAVCLIFVGVCEAVFSSVIRGFGLFSVGDRWFPSGFGSEVIALYLPSSEAVSSSQAAWWEREIASALKSVSVDESPAFCFGFSDGVTVSCDRKSATASALVVDGDFFLFHPCGFVSGSSFPNDASNPMTLVLDENLAWRLFGSTDVSGFTVDLGGLPFTVTGVSKPIGKEKDGETPGLIVNGVGYRKLVPEENQTVTFFEALLPEPVSGFALDKFKSATGREDAIEITSRFSLKNRARYASALSENALRAGSVPCPVWETAARKTEFKISLFFIFECAALASAGILMIVCPIILFWKGKSKE